MSEQPEDTSPISNPQPPILPPPPGQPEPTEPVPAAQPQIPQKDDL
jgi:hypothetical protein